MDSSRIKVVPAQNGFSCTRFGGYGRLSFWKQLEEGLFMAMIGLILRYHHNIRLFYLGQVRDGTGDEPFRDGEPRRSDDGATDQPWVDEDAVCAI